LAGGRAKKVREFFVGQEGGRGGGKKGENVIMVSGSKMWMGGEKKTAPDQCFTSQGSYSNCRAIQPASAGRGGKRRFGPRSQDSKREGGKRGSPVPISAEKGEGDGGTVSPDPLGIVRRGKGLHTQRQVRTTHLWSRGMGSVGPTGVKKKKKGREEARLMSLVVLSQKKKETFKFPNM